MGRVLRSQTLNTFDAQLPNILSRERLVADPNPMKDAKLAMIGPRQTLARPSMVRCYNLLQSPLFTLI